jgi:pimeloyl-ACP methyl ester carboxylesterase
MTIETRYRAIDVPVRGGDLRVGIWEPETGGIELSSAPAVDETVIAIHGVTATHRCWLSVADQLTGNRVIAPDLRGRGRSRDLPRPYGMAQHADDIASAMDFLKIPSAVLVAHSMGAWVALAMFDRHPTRIQSLVLVDGGLPLPTPEGVTDEELTTLRLGPAKERLSMTFPDRDSYQRFFRAHPAFAEDWNEAVTDYVDYDLVGEPPQLTATTRFAAMADDSVDLQGSERWLLPALHRLPDGTQFLRAQRGMLGAEPGLYPPEWIAAWQQRLPNIDRQDVRGVNHYTILFSDFGAASVAQAVRRALGQPTGIRR